MTRLQRSPITLHDDVTLTAAYSGNTGTGTKVEDSNQLSLLIEYTMGAAETSNSLLVKLEYSHDNTNWSHGTTESISSGVVTLNLESFTFAAVSAAGTRDKFQILRAMNATYFRTSLKETGIASNAGTAKVTAILSYV